jgi:hypothetical protein
MTPRKSQVSSSDLPVSSSSSEGRLRDHGGELRLPGRIKSRLAAFLLLCCGSIIQAVCPLPIPSGWPPFCCWWARA